tara:strand:+ start:530 stop:1474 length:945 start_codon:yes stop_codon:yes gene_type:complete
MRLLSEVRDTIDTWERLLAQSSSLLELIQIAQEENDSSLESSVRDELTSLESELGKLEFDLVFSGEYDNRSAILTVHAGAGGTESQDWAQMLLRMYLRWAERKGYKSRILDSSPGDEAGIKSAMVEIEGRLAYGYTKTEHGVHRLVRISPFDSSKSRHTSFALIEVLPEADEDITITISSDDLRIDTFGAGGHGGQNVQKNSTAVRITHLPTNIVVTCQNERSLTQNRETAMKVLRARLMDLEINKRAEEEARLKGDRISAEWGSQIRSYVLHPYKLVKDHRTGHESKDPNAVLDGELDELIEAFLLSTVGNKK